MTVEVTPSKATYEDHPYGDGTAREYLREPATAEVEFEDWSQVEAAFRDWAAGEKFSDVFNITADGENETRHVEPENITFVLRDQPVVAPAATTQLGRNPSAADETILRGVIFCCACLALGWIAGIIIFKLYI